MTEVFKRSINQSAKSKGVCKLLDEHIERVKSCQKVHEYLSEIDKSFVNLWRTKETEPRII